MIALLIAALAAFAPMNLEVPPEVPIDVITESATATETAVRGTQVQMTETSPPPETTPTFANDCDEMHWYRVNAGLPARFDSLGWRESNCRNEEGVHTGCCWGWWQLNVGLHLRDHRLAGRYHDCGVWSRTDVDSDTPQDKARQACAAKALFDVVGYSAWSL